MLTPIAGGDIKIMNCEHLRNLKHELRTPVNHILGYSELLLETADDFDDQTLAVLAQSIKAHGQLLARLLEQAFLAPADQIGEQQLNGLRSTVGPVIADILSVSCSPPEGSGSASYEKDLERIRLAAHKLMTLISASGTDCGRSTSGGSHERRSLRVGRDG